MSLPTSPGFWARLAAETTKVLYVTTPPNNVNRSDRRRVTRQEFQDSIKEIAEDFRMARKNNGPTLVKFYVPRNHFQDVRERVKNDSNLHIQKSISDS